MEDHIIGHKYILEFFRRAQKNNTLSHAYCFVGSRHVGKLTLAREIAAWLLETSVERLYLCPDFLYLMRERHEKTETLKKDISIEQIRKAKHFFGQYAFKQDAYKVLILDDADYLSARAANALLKTLEEPGRRAILFLLTSNYNQIMATLRSRCHGIFFSHVSPVLLETHAREHGLDKDLAKEMARYAHGLPGLLHSWLSDPLAYEMYKQELQRFVSLFHIPLYQKMKYVEELFGDKTDHVAARGRLLEVFDIWYLGLRDMIFAETKNKSLDHSLILGIEESLLKARQYVRQNVHPRLLVDQVLLRIP
ncbi:MAG: AAA family ATPase [Candidatus Magasanikbacteria bacterium]|nr:AAA family ATPase [Candidatus Magasanikbacteria bacterium]